MKKIILSFMIGTFAFLSSPVFSDIIMPGSRCYDYDKTCYSECLSKDRISYQAKGECKKECCIKERKFCTNKSCSCLLKTKNNWAYCKTDERCSRDCTNGEKAPVDIEIIIKTIFVFIIISIISFLIYRRKTKKG